MVGGVSDLIVGSAMVSTEIIGDRSNRGRARWGGHPAKGLMPVPAWSFCAATCECATFTRLSSTENSATNAWIQRFSDGNQNNNNKTNTYRVRAVRRREAIDMQADFTIEDLLCAYYDCRRTKRNTAQALLFEERLERNIMDLYYELQDGSYRPGRSLCFVVEYPKVREIWAAQFRDRIVHHLLYNHVADRFHRRFIQDTFACIPGRGIHVGADKVAHMLRSASENYSRPTWFLKADIANFFVSIDRGVLDGLLARHIDEPWWLYLCRLILHHDVSKNAEIRSPKWLMAKVPRHKSLIHSGGRGLPIGNLSSQFFANVYLNELDQFAKRGLRCRYYARYVARERGYYCDRERTRLILPKRRLPCST